MTDFFVWVIKYEPSSYLIIAVILDLIVATILLFKSLRKHAILGYFLAFILFIWLIIIQLQNQPW